MIAAGYDAWLNQDLQGGVSVTHSVYRAMLSAAPDAIGGGEAADIVRRWANWIIDESADMEVDDHDAGKRKVRHERDVILAALSAASTHGGGWQPIDTAPKTDPANMVALPFIAWCPHPDVVGGGDQRVCWWEPKTRGGQWWSDRDLPENPTLWRPLSDNPETVDCEHCGGTGVIVEEARTTGANQHSACQMACDECDGTGSAPSTTAGEGDE